MIRTSRAKFAASAAAGGMVPVAREVVLDADTAITAFAKLHRGEFGFLLESLQGGERWARYTFLATEPYAVYQYRGGHIRHWTPDAGWESVPDADPLDHVAQLMRQETPVPAAGLPRFTGGAVGFLGYDVVRSLERLGVPPPDDRQLPDAVVMIADTVLALDNAFHSAIVIASVRVPAGASAAHLDELYTGATARIEAWIARLREPAELPALEFDRVPAAPSTTSPYEADRFVADVERIREYIRAGDIFQAVLSRRMDLAAPDPFLAYRYLRALNPAPYLFYLRLGELSLVGSSPEVLVRVEDGELTVRPIAGTRPRGATPADDALLEAELLADPKVRAEHMMLVDLGRNDVGRVSRYGTVAVRSLMAVERYSHVMHLVSEVRGALRDDTDAVAALAACFPAGTVSGAPKIRAMQIIDELEPTRRGPYAGAVGYVGWGGRTLDTAIAIRTAVIQNGRAWVQAGAGIVVDSDPHSELRETEAKARAVLVALALAGAP
jgi:anthranilate synthase component 1